MTLFSAVGRCSTLIIPPPVRGCVDSGADDDGSS